METITISKQTVQAIINTLSTVETRGAGNMNALLGSILTLQNALNPPQNALQKEANPA